MEDSEVDNEMGDSSSQGVAAVAGHIIMLDNNEWSGEQTNNNELAIALVRQEDFDEDDYGNIPAASVHPMPQLALPPVGSDSRSPETAMDLVVPYDMSIVLTEETTTPEEGRQPALPSSIQRPAVLAGNEVGRTAPYQSSTSHSTTANSLVAPSTSTNYPKTYPKRRPVEVSNTFLNQ